MTPGAAPRGREAQLSLSARRRGQVGRMLTASLASLALVAGVSLATATVIAPEQVGAAYGDAQAAVGQWRIGVAHEVPRARLGDSGGEPELDRCDGTFTHMQSYRGDDIPPIWAAHNNCGGDVILPLAVGDEVDVELDRQTTRYTVVDVRETPKVWATTALLEGLQGELALQTCVYGGADVPMRFVGLVPSASAVAP